MNWLSYIVPRTVLVTSSSHNAEIRVQMVNGRMRLLVNGIEQSGAAVQKFWQFAYSSFPWPTRAASVLVLGVGGGTVIHMLRSRYPESAITAVDVDPEIVRLSRGYFGLGDMEKLTLTVSDAGKFLARRGRKFDLIVSDLYVGRDIPGFESSVPYVRAAKKRLAPGGAFVINFLHDGDYAVRAGRLANTLRREFADVRSADLPYNRFFFAR